MAIKYTLILRSSASPHIYLDTIKEMIKDDNELLPQTKRALMLMKRLKKSFIQIPLQMEVVVSPIHKSNLERTLSPALGDFHASEWSEENISSYKKDSKVFLEKVKKLYNKMGYEVTESLFDDKKAGEIITSVSVAEKKLLEKLEKKNSEPEQKPQAKKPMSLTPSIPMPTINMPKLDVPKIDLQNKKKQEKKK